MKLTVDVEIPEKAKWIAQDESGSWCWYENKPKPVARWKIWDDTAAGDHLGFLITVDIMPSGVKVKNWKEQLYEITWK